MKKIVFGAIFSIFYSMSSHATVYFDRGIDNFFIEGEDTRNELIKLLEDDLADVISNNNLIEDGAKRLFEEEAIGAQAYDYHYSLTFYIKPVNGNNVVKKLKLKLTDINEFNCDRIDCSNYRLVLRDFKVLDLN